jgi:glutaminase-like protein
MDEPPRVPRLLPPGWLAPLAGRRRPAPPPGPPGSDPPGSAGRPLTAAEAAALFADLAGADIPFDYPVNYCFARAHEMRRLMEAREPPVASRKVWNFSPNLRRAGGTHDENRRLREDGALSVRHPAMGTCLWTYHVAPTVVVEGPDGPRPMVLDPALFEGPVTIEEWRAAQGVGESIVEETGGEVYVPVDARDDDYSRTQEDLERARMAHAAWVHGLVPDAADFEDGLVPDGDEDPTTQEVPA